MDDQPDMDTIAKKQYAILDNYSTKGAVESFEEMISNYSGMRT